MAKQNLPESADKQSPVSAVSAVGHEVMDSSRAPALIVNPEASARDLAVWACSELEGLHTWLHLVECSELEIEFPVEDFAKLVRTRLESVLLGLTEARTRD